MVFQNTCWIQGNGLKMRNKFLPYGKQSIDKDDISEVDKVLKSDWLTTGPKVSEFEENFCRYICCKYAVAVNSGTSALDIAVASIGLKKGSEIITTPFTFVATANCILYNNLKPVFVDIKKDTYNINPDEIKKKITSKTKAIIYVDYAGQPCDISEIIKIANENNLYLIEDAAHACGAEYKNKKVGNFADLTEFSFHPVKHITTGEGGMVTTDNKELYEKLKLLRNHGIDKDATTRFGKDASYAYDMKLLGRNYRITDFQCALGISQLKKLDDFIKRREQIVKIYDEEFENIDEVTTPYVKTNIKHAWHIYTILLYEKINRDKFFNLMKAKNIGVNVHYIPIYKFSYYKENFNFNDKDFTVTEDVFSRIITLPLFQGMNDEDAYDVINAVKNTINELS
ncbi:MAG: UDP-4-amino-4,6-dideoxy-N-acetyl-beta-L-altrosamine transaminase [Candidatus Altarchaeum sp. CG12_big_fil_rev_8_21_14_0_65_33_22]|nr:MAG: UDP-4-amino-4,6-dideoxy-N-acetyl-beta-L-altrosamine transaminase [Candidatus Altarchaeum sp. CG12_big_fil_rev_8_21_14_0_65_33_22]PIX48945.1 MAG: UDP-4-amino-4,6-dideoxy-N-acetyl-beta-L-altrosamine transaminase [Candidatus Altarchaeum sp. CG_4_8_14_3_um_filter_33_2054]PIZ32394.1 MAG: UDP-4-amino-4,6-dideoxy-N-acetyl-beta-L-altrosamine transaminase [Candidatus Altarchaeum sp. CG_4_10_14_0_8_um_filter_32_851]